jgi:hypothetical protein
MQACASKLEIQLLKVLGFGFEKILKKRLETTQWESIEQVSMGL